MTGRSLFDLSFDAPGAAAQAPPAAASPDQPEVRESAPVAEAAGSESRVADTTVEHGASDASEEGEAHGEAPHEGGGGHSDPVAPLLLQLVLILISAKIGGDIFDRLGQPAVLGELIAGVVAGNVMFFLGDDFMAVLREGTTIIEAAGQMAAGADPRATLTVAFQGDGDAVQRFLAMIQAGTFFGHVELASIIDILSRLGVIVLLFMVGLESDFKEMMAVGVTSLLVAVIGVVAPFALGYAVSWVLIPEASTYVHLFIGATLCATSVGITARVFKDLDKLQTTEAKIILGAAVIDDILGLIILAVVQGIIIAADLPPGAESVSLAAEIAKIFALAVLFLGGAIFVGLKFQPLLARLVARMRVPGMKLVYSLCFAFLLAWLADLIGLAAIVGAFAAGLVLDEVHFKDFKGEHHHLEEKIEPIATFLVPIFFIQMGLQVKLETFAQVSILGLALGITVAAVVGKQVCGLAVRDPKISKISIGFGMIPRGEVGLIFAAIGKTLTFQGRPVIDSGTFSAVVIMVILTTLLTPPLLKISMSKAEAAPAPAD